MLTGSIYGWESGKDDIFDPQSLRNRDNCLEPMRLMEELARKNDISLHTADVNALDCITPDFSLYVESVDFVPCGAKKHFLILYETSLTVPRNANVQYLDQFDFIFTWDKGLLSGGLQDESGLKISHERFIKIQYPNPRPPECGPNFYSVPFEGRSDFICLIGSNRHANAFDKRELYSERVKAIKWFEEHAIGDFKLYGNGWRVPQKRLGRLGKLRYRTEKILPFLLRKPVFPSYQGPAKTKYEVLSKAKFCICYENARDIDGYITEKIFDCLFAGCIPIYWGDANISQSVPAECFVDFRQFSSYADLYHFLKGLSPAQYFGYQLAAREFLMSDRFLPFGSENFARTIVNHIKNEFSLV